MKVSSRLQRLNPLHAVNQIPFTNPVYRVAVKYTWGKEQTAIFAISRRWLRVGVAIGVVLWLLPFLYLAASYPSGVYAAFSFPPLIGVATVLVLNLILDSRMLNSALPLVQGERRRGRWDLLRVTTLRDGEIIAGLRAAALVNHWRLLMFCTGVRVGIVLGSLLNLILSAVYATLTPLPFWATGNNFSEVASVTPMIEGGSVLATLLLILFICGLWIVESRLRSVAMTTLGMTVSTHTSEGSSAALFSTLIALGIYLLRFATVIAMLLLFSAFFSFIVFAAARLIRVSNLLGNQLIYHVLLAGLIGASILVTETIRIISTRRLARRLYTLANNT